MDMGVDAKSLLACAIKTLEVDGNLLDSRCWFEAAYLESERTGDKQAMARAALGLCGLWVHEHRTAVTSSLIQARLRQSLALVDPASTLALRLRIRDASEADYRQGEHARVLAALDQARAAQDPVALIEALSQAHHCLLGPDHGAKRQALADEMAGAAAKSGYQGHLLMALLWQVVDLFLAGDSRVERRLSELRAHLDDHDHLAVSYVRSAIDVMLAIRAGRLAEAERLATECLKLGRKAGDLDADGWFGAQFVAIRWYQGRLPELLPELTELASSPTLSAVDHSFTAARAVAAAQAGDYLAAASALAAVRGRSLAELPRSSSWLVTMYGVVEAAHLLSDATAAAEAYELLRPFADLPMMASLAVACFGSVHHALGVALMTTGDLDGALNHLSDGLCRNFALGHWPAVNVSRLRFAEALERRAGPRDLAMAEDLRGRAAKLAGTLGLGPPTPADPVRCARHGVRWRFELGSRSVLVGHSVGMLHLAVLIANPNAEIAAIDLVAGLESVNRAMPAQQMLDRTAVRQYRQRLAKLRDEQDAEVERDWLLRELDSASRPGRRPRAFADSAERARIAVGRSIRRALATIEGADAVIGAHLRAAVYTGTKCWYRPV